MVIGGPRGGGGGGRKGLPCSIGAPRQPLASGNIAQHLGTLLQCRTKPWPWLPPAFVKALPGVDRAFRK